MVSRLNTIIKSYGAFSTEIENNANEMEESYSQHPSMHSYNTIYQACIDSLTKLLKHTESLCEETTLLLDTQVTAIQNLSDDEVNINRELSCRKLLGERTIVKQKPITKNIIIPTEPCVIEKVVNASLDISKFDSTGHGATRPPITVTNKTSSITLKVPENIKEAVFKELNGVDFYPECISTFWIGDGQSSGGTAASNNLNAGSLSVTQAHAPRASVGSRTNKKSTSMNKSSTLTKTKNNTFRQRNSLTIKASAPNDISDDIFTNMMSVSSCNILTDSPDFDFIRMGLIDNCMNSNALSSVGTIDGSLSKLEPSNIRVEVSDSHSNNLSYDSTFQNSSAPLKFPTPKTVPPDNPAVVETNANVPNNAPPPPPVVKNSSTNPSFLYKARVLYDYEKSLDDELTITNGNIVEIITEGDDGWFVARLGNLVGSIPGNYVEKI